MPAVLPTPDDTSPRMGSPVGPSILMTSAPQSARTPPADGTKPHIDTSTTRTPSSGSLLVPPVALLGVRNVASRQPHRRQVASSLARLRLDGPTRTRRGWRGLRVL